MGREWGRDSSLHYHYCLLVSPDRFIGNCAGLGFSSVLLKFHVAESSVQQIFFVCFFLCTSAVLLFSCNSLGKHLRSQAGQFSCIAHVFSWQNKYLLELWEISNHILSCLGIRDSISHSSETVQIWIVEHLLHAQHLVCYRADLYSCLFAHSCSREHAGLRQWGHKPNKLPCQQCAVNVWTAGIPT